MSNARPSLVLRYLAACLDHVRGPHTVILRSCRYENTHQTIIFVALVLFCEFEGWRSTNFGLRPELLCSWQGGLQLSAPNCARLVSRSYREDVNSRVGVAVWTTPITVLASQSCASFHIIHPLNSLLVRRCNDGYYRRKLSPARNFCASSPP
jgi:hypothetical protein